MQKKCCFYKKKEKTPHLKNEIKAYKKTGSRNTFEATYEILKEICTNTQKKKNY